MNSKEYELIKEHINIKFDTLSELLRSKARDDKEKDKLVNKRIDKIEKRVFGLILILAAVFKTPEVISLILKG